MLWYAQHVVHVKWRDLKEPVVFQVLEGAAFHAHPLRRKVSRRHRRSDPQGKQRLLALEGCFCILVHPSEVGEVEYPHHEPAAVVSVDHCAAGAVGREGVRKGAPALFRHEIKKKETLQLNPKP